MAIDQHLVDAFYRAALFLKARIKYDGWGWSSNYLREHARCAYGLRFTNTQSPDIYDELIRQHPELKELVTVKPRNRPMARLQRSLFDKSPLPD
jgi:hypothetical protein